jgi:hypothetical protein
MPLRLADHCARGSPVAEVAVAQGEEAEAEHARQPRSVESLRELDDLVEGAQRLRRSSEEQVRESDDAQTSDQPPCPGGPF